MAHQATNCLGAISSNFVSPITTLFDLTGVVSSHMQTKKLSLTLILCLILVGLSGCVQRRLIVRSQPEGAFVTIDRQPIGLTPLSVPYTYSGTREIQLEKDGYKTVKVQQRIDPTWYEKFPVSFVTENFWPREIRDERLLLSLIHI